MDSPLASTRGHRLRLALGGVAVVMALLAGISGIAASADRPDFGPGWDYRHGHSWTGNPPSAPYGYGPHGTYRRQPAACGTNTVVGAAFGAGVGGLIGSQLSDRPGDAGPTVMGMVIGAIFGGILGQSADRANGC